MSNTLPPTSLPSSSSWPARIVEGVRRRLGYLGSESRKIETASADAVVTALESFATGIEALQGTLTKVQGDFLTAQGQLGELGRASARAVAGDRGARHLRCAVSPRQEREARAAGQDPHRWWWASRRWPVADHLTPGSRARRRRKLRRRGR